MPLPPARSCGENCVKISIVAVVGLAEALTVIEGVTLFLLQYNCALVASVVCGWRVTGEAD